ncbi:MAG TPA: DoxX family protein [Gammaproteobacteria bacterium]|nr:DoxX family protein [Gammaproteobacteria bacterium]
MDELLWIVGRFLLGGLYVAGGIKHFFIMNSVLEMMKARGVPYPKIVLVAGSIFQLVCGLLFILGISIPLAAAGLIVFTIAASVMLLNFWGLEPGPAREGLMNAFLTNIALVGGLLIAAANSP